MKFLKQLALTLYLVIGGQLVLGVFAIGLGFALLYASPVFAVIGFSVTVWWIWRGPVNE